MDLTGANVRSLPVSVFRLEPPYLELRPVHDLASTHRRGLPRGTILVLGIGHAERPASPLLKDGAEHQSGVSPVMRNEEAQRLAMALAPAIVGIRKRFFAQPLALYLAGTPEQLALEIARLAADLRVRGLLLDRDDMAATLRRQLTNPGYLAADFLAWLPFRGVQLSVFARSVIEQIFLGARQHRPLADTIRHLGLGGARMLRDRFQREGLPSPRKWRQLAEASYAVLQLQRTRGPLLANALELGYSDSSSLSHQITAVFGVSPGAIKETIGWEWWMDSWICSQIDRPPRRWQPQPRSRRSQRPEMDTPGRPGPS